MYYIGKNPKGCIPVWKRKMNALDKTALVLVIIGAINWGLVAFGINLVPIISFGSEVVASIIYLLVGISGLYAIKLLV